MNAVLGSSKRSRVLQLHAAQESQWFSKECSCSSGGCNDERVQGLGARSSPWTPSYRFRWLALKVVSYTLHKLIEQKKTYNPTRPQSRKIPGTDCPALLATSGDFLGYGMACSSRATCIASQNCWLL